MLAPLCLDQPTQENCDKTLCIVPCIDCAKQWYCVENSLCPTMGHFRARFTVPSREHASKMIICDKNWIIISMANFSQRRFLKNPRKYSHTIYIYIDRKILDHQKIHRRFSNSRRIVIAGTYVYATAERDKDSSATDARAPPATDRPHASLCHKCPKSFQEEETLWNPAEKAV